LYGISPLDITSKINLAGVQGGQLIANGIIEVYGVELWKHQSRESFMTCFENVLTNRHLPIGIDAFCIPFSMVKIWKN
jgi:hypothetical protein